MKNRKCFSANISSWGESNHHYLPVPATIAAPLLEQGHTRVQVQFNEAPPFHCALRRNKEVGFLIGVSKRLLQQTDTEPGQVVQVEIWPDESPYQAPMPESLAAVLETDTEAHTIFHSMTAGRQRSILYWVGSLRNLDRQIEKALLVAEKLKAGLLDPRKW